MLLFICPVVLIGSPDGKYELSGTTSKFPGESSLKIYLIPFLLKSSKFSFEKAWKWAFTIELIFKPNLSNSFSKRDHFSSKCDFENEQPFG